MSAYPESFAWKQSYTGLDAYALSLIAPIKRAGEEAFGLAQHATETPLIKSADLIALATERRDLFGPSPRDNWGGSTHAYPVSSQ